MPDRSSFSRQIILYAHRLSTNGFVAAYDGNISARTKRGTFLVTASGFNKGEISSRSIIEVDGTGTVRKGRLKPSTELPMHLAIYRERADVQAIVHAHPPYATAFAAAGKELPTNVLPEVIVGLGRIPLAPYATPSTDEVGRSLLPFIRNCDAVLLSNHGAVTMGSDVRDAYFKMEKLEHYARIIFLARQLGGERTLTTEQLRLLAGVSEKSYGRSIKL